MPDSLPQQKPSSTSCIDHVHDDLHRTRDRDGENQAHSAPDPALDEQGYGHHERVELETLTNCHSGPYDCNILAIQVPKCTHGAVRDAHCSLRQHAEKGISKALETRMNERFLSLGQFLQDTQVATRNGIGVSQIATEGSTSRAHLWLLPWISLGAASFSGLCQQRVV
jgi:hypothetical protein